ncbi:S2-RNase [Pyrus ussuriensis x Pyrus communis]|uniref:S2-RNase n=1 Tax=Pyrus ussuriensis x Pyrus communis TaxID=2448454 RepID=A0A5N5IBI5_9ROSA|nr:S2-RNase [Pyrus ussuriensis x Pyrus communis]
MNFMTRSSQPVRGHILEFDDDFERTLRRKKTQPEPNPSSSSSESEFEEEEEEHDMAVDNRTIKELSASGLDNVSSNQIPSNPIPPNVSFPHMFMQSKKEESEKDILETFRKVQVNIPLLDAIKQVPKYAKFLKKLCTIKKRIPEKKVIHVSENVSVVLQRKLPPKCKDPGELKNESVIIQLVHRSNAYPKGVLEDVLVQISVSGATFIPAMKSKSGRKMVNFAHKAGGGLKLPDVDSSSTVVQRGQGWLGFAPGMMGYKAQVVASAITLPICRKIKKGARSTVRTANFRGLKPPHTVVNQGGSWVGLVEGNESFKMVVVASKKSIGVGRNRPWKMGGREGKNAQESWELSFFFFFFFFLFSFFLIG